MSDVQTSDREDKLLTLLANPLTRAILSILVGIDPGYMTEKILEEIRSDS